MTVGENVALQLREWTDLPEEAIAAIVSAKLRLVGLQSSEDKMPAELSGGMKKRAAIARAMALEPGLMFLDEPSAGLDPTTAAELDELLLSLNASLGLTLVLVTHDLESIMKIAEPLHHARPGQQVHHRRGRPPPAARHEPRPAGAILLPSDGHGGSVSAPTNRWKLGLFVLGTVLAGLGAAGYLAARTFQRETIGYRSYFDEGVTGLENGATVSFRGVKVGNVSAIDIAPDRRHVEITFQLGVSALQRLGITYGTGKHVKMAIPPDLRVQIGSTGFTGSKYLQLDFLDAAKHPAPELPFPVAENTIPSMPSTMDAVYRAMDQLPDLTREFGKSLEQVTQLLAEVRAQNLPNRTATTLASVDRILASVERKLGQLKVDELSGEAKAALANLDAAMTKTNRLLDHMDGDSWAPRQHAANVGRARGRGRRREGPRSRARGHPDRPAWSRGRHSRAGRCSRARPGHVRQGKEQGREMMRLRSCWVVCAFVGSTTIGGCALLGKSEPLLPRYYAPEYAAAATAPSLPAPNLRLRLGRVSAWSHLRERMVISNSAQEIRYYDDRRWTERPEIYLQRALSGALFEERGLVRVISGVAPTLDVELASFEEVRAPSSHSARLVAHVVLHDERIGRLEETVTVEEPIRAAPDVDQGRASTEAFSVALRTGVARIADDVVAKLSAMAAAERAEPGRSTTANR